MPLSEKPVTHRYQAIVLGFALIIGMCLVGGGFALYDRFQTNNARRAQQAYINTQLAKATERNQQALRLVLCEARAASISNPRATPEQKEAAIEFYDRVVRLIHARPCVVP